MLTNIGLDHTKVLGNTVEAIAATKAGIIKPGCHAVLYPCAPSVQEVVAVRCRAGRRTADCGGLRCPLLSLRHAGGADIQLRPI